MHKKRISFKILIIPLAVSAVLHILLAVMLPVGAALDVKLFREEVAKRFDIVDVVHVQESRLTGQKTERLVTLDPAALARAFSDITKNANLSAAEPKLLALSPVAPAVADSQPSMPDFPTIAREVDHVLQTSAQATAKLAPFYLPPAERIKPDDSAELTFDRTFEQPLQPGTPMILQNSAPSVDDNARPLQSAPSEKVPAVKRPMPAARLDLIKDTPSPAIDDEPEPAADQSLPMSTTIGTFRKNGDADVFFRLMIAADENGLQPLPKSVLFLIDISKSMSEQAIVEAKNAIARCLPCLESGDSFNVLTFGSELRRAFPTGTQANPETLKAALDFIPAALEEGTVDAAQALAKALDGEKNPQPVIVFVITNGATVRPAEAVKQDLAVLANRISGNTVISTFCAGKSPLFPLFETPAILGNGQAVSVPEAKESAKALVDLVTSYCKPLMTNVSCTPAIPEEEPPYGQTQGVYFAARPIVLYGKTRASTIAVSVTGTTASGTKAFFKIIRLPSPDSNNQYIAQSWARKKIRFLQEKILTSADAAAVAQQIKQLSTKFAVPAPDVMQ